MTSTSAPHAEPRRATTWAIAAALALVTLLLYWPALDGALVHDDVASLARAATAADVSVAGRSEGGASAAPGVWRPVTDLALRGWAELGATGPRPYHALSIALHALATAAAFVFALRWMRNVFAAAASALVFAVHPVQVESVAWISALDGVVSGAFALLALAAFLAWRDRGARGSPWLAGALSALALFSTEAALAIFPVALALDAARARAAGEPLLAHDAKRAYAPFAVAIGVWYVARVVVFESPLAGLDALAIELGLSARRLALLRIELFGDFLRLLAAPTDARVFRPLSPQIGVASSAFLAPLACAAAGVAIAAWAYARRDRIVLGLSALMLVPIALLLVRPEILGPFPLADRHVYVAAAGAAGLAAHAAFRWLPRAGASALVGAIAALFAWETHARIGTWRDQVTLLESAAARTPRSMYVQWSLGRVLLEQYRDLQQPELLRRSHDAFQRALELGAALQRGDTTLFATSDDFLRANVGLGWTWLHLAEIDNWRDYQTAEAVFQGVVDRYPRSAEGWTGLAVAQIQLGELDAADSALAKALELDPGFVEAHVARGALRGKHGDWAGARAAYEEALRWRPNHLETLLRRGGAEERAGDDTAAAATFDLAARLHPLDARPIVARGTLSAKRGDLDGALRDFDAAIERKSDLGQAWLQKGRVLAARGEKHGAERAFVRAAELLPTSFEANYNAGAALLATEGVPSAGPFLVRAYELRPRGAQGDELRASLASMPIQGAETFMALATADADRGEPRAALEWVARVLALDPNHGAAHFLKGGMLRQLDDRDGAYAEIKRASQLLPDSYLVHETLGDFCLELGRREEAIASFERALSIARNTPSTHPAASAALQSLRGKIEALRAGG